MAEATSAVAMVPKKGIIVGLFTDLFNLKGEINANSRHGLLPGFKLGLILDPAHRHLQVEFDAKLKEFAPLLLVELNALYSSHNFHTFGEVNLNAMRSIHSICRSTNPSVLAEFVSKITGNESDISFLELYEILYYMFE